MKYIIVEIVIGNAKNALDHQQIALFVMEIEYYQDVDVLLELTNYQIKQLVQHVQ